MKKKKHGTKSKDKQLINNGITALSVCGFKSISRETKIEVRPLTILAGANSSGKSSVMQPLLLLKQTLETAYDPGPLLLSGPNVMFTSREQLLSRNPNQCGEQKFCIEIQAQKADFLRLCFEISSEGRGFEVVGMKFRTRDEQVSLKPRMTNKKILSVVPDVVRSVYKKIYENEKPRPRWTVAHDRCFLTWNLIRKHETLTPLMVGNPGELFKPHIQNLLHVPALRANPTRAYPATAVGPSFPGAFDEYLASVIAQWQTEKDERMRVLNKNLKTLGITWKVAAKFISDTQIEIHLGRVPKPKKGGSRDLVSIADVGFGVSQILPVLIALLLASPGQVVYIEQPEIHLHPRAQLMLATILVEAAKRGVKVIAETHSALLLKGIQTQVAKGDISPDLIKLHWFVRRTEDGVTEVSSADLDENGAFGEWPEDFGEVEMNAEKAYLDA
jgi:hypothetical protein